MITHIAYKYRLYPNKTQQLFFAKTFGCCRKIWNLLLNDYNNIGKVSSLLTPYKEQYTYLKDVDSLALTNTWKYFTNAIRSYYKIQNRNKPRFKKKNSIQSYTTSCIKNNIRIEGYNSHSTKKKQRVYIRLPKIGLIKMIHHRPLPQESVIKHVTVTKTLTNEYYISINVEYDNQVIPKILDIRNSIGIDYSLHNLIITSDINTQYYYENKYRKNQHRLAKYQSLRDKASKGSKKRYKFTMKLRRLHRDIANQRYDYLHKVSCDLSRRYDYIFIENLDLMSMASKHGKYHLGKSIYDNSFGMFRTLLQYKLIRNGNKYLCVIDKYYPSTQRCSYCGYVNTLLRNNLSIREWQCPRCNILHDRDFNAAVNIHSRGIQLYYKYMRYISLPVYDNIPLNDYILNIDKYDIKQHILLQEIVTQIPKEERKILIVYQVPKNERKISIVDQIKK